MRESVRRLATGSASLFLERVKRFFGSRPPLNAASAKIDEQVYLLNYRHHYSSILEDKATPARLAELFLFRAWTAQFGYRIFSADVSASEKLLSETVNASHYLGLPVFQQLHGFSVEEVLGDSFLNLIEDRWHDYDSAVIGARLPGSLPTIAIVSALTNRLASRCHDATLRRLPGPARDGQERRRRTRGVGVTPNKRMKLPVRAGCRFAEKRVTRLVCLGKLRTRTAAYARIRYAAKPNPCQAAHLYIH
jgi:hypothetical protein